MKHKKKEKSFWRSVVEEDPKVVSHLIIIAIQVAEKLIR